MTRATTVEEVKRAESEWSMGIGPDKLHNALGWTEDELAAYKTTGNLPVDVDKILPPPGPPAPPPAIKKRAAESEPSTLSADQPFWLLYTRWRPKPLGDDLWSVVGQRGEVDIEGPTSHKTYGKAQDRADHLNRTERDAALERDRQDRQKGVPAP